jgi:hypothetical protein
MKNVTYLVGAGASANCLPLVKDFDIRMEQLIHLFQEEQYQISAVDSFKDFNSKTKKEIQEDFINNLQWLIIECKNHASIDTYAKKLFLKGETVKLKTLKVTLSVFLVFAQCLNNYDKRYDTFFASILQNLYSLPRNIKIISWNYDLQIERAYGEFKDHYSLEQNNPWLNIKSKFLKRNYVNDDGFCVCKLNGSATIIESENFNYPYTEINSVFDRQTIEKALYKYALLLFTETDRFSGLSFAWENGSGGENDILTKTKLATVATDVLVVIGYSFPFFNREIDREIIQNMKKLEKVYFQAPDAKNLVERFESIRPDIDIKKLVPRFDIDQFLLPNELSL